MQHRSWIGLIIVFPVVFAHAENWQKLDSTTAKSLLGASIQIWLDKDSLVRTADKVNYWARFQPDPSSPVELYSVTSDCKNKTVQVQQAFYLLKEITPMQYSPDVSPIVVGTAAEVMFKAVCPISFYDFWKP